MASKTRIPTGGSLDLNQLEALLSADAVQRANDLQQQAFLNEYNLKLEDARALKRLRDAGVVRDLPDAQGTTRPTASKAGLSGRLTGQATIADAASPNVSTSGGSGSLLDRLSGRKTTPTQPAPQVQPVQTRSTPSSQAPGLSARLAGRSAGAPSPPVPSPAPVLNPRNLTRAAGVRPVSDLARAVNQAIAPAGRALAPLANRLAPAARVLGAGYRAIAPAIPYISAGLDFAGGLQAGESVGRAGAGALGGLGGALAGAQAGAAIGTLIAPGLGTIAGGIIGGAIGGFGGGWLADRLYDTLFPNDALPSTTDPLSRGPAPPFYGGQSSGVLYHVDIYLLRETRVAGFSSQLGEEQFRVNNVTGPIRGLSERVVGSHVELTILHGNNQITGTFSQSNNVASTPAFKSYRITNLVRADGQPDTAGNPSAQPGTLDQPALAPIVPPSPTIAPSPTQAPSSPTNPTNLSPGTPTDPFTPQNSVVPSNPLAPSAPPTPATNPALAPTADPQQGDTPIWNPIGALPFLLPAIMPAALGNRGSYPQLWRPPSITSSITTGGGTDATSPNPVCRFIADPHTPAINGRTQQMEIVQLAIQAYQTQMLTQVDTKLGPQVEGGLSGYVKKFWKWFHVDRIMNLLTFWVTVHNAIMLSNNIGQTLFGAFDIVMEIFKKDLKDDEGSEISTSEWVGNQFDEILKSVFGDQNVDTVKGVWTRANRIYQATANIANAVQGMMYSITEGLEAVGKYVALIGNAAKRFGVVSERAYGWMNVNPNFRTNKFFKVLDGLQEGAEAVEVVAGETQNIIQMKDEIQTQKDELKGLIQEGEEGKKEEEDDSKKESIYPAAAAVKDADLIKPEE